MIMIMTRLARCGKFSRILLLPLCSGPLTKIHNITASVTDQAQRYHRDYGVPQLVSVSTCFSPMKYMRIRVSSAFHLPFTCALFSWSPPAWLFLCRALVSFSQHFLAMEGLFFIVSTFRVHGGFPNRRSLTYFPSGPTFGWLPLY